MLFEELLSISVVLLIGINSSLLMNLSLLKVNKQSSSFNTMAKSMIRDLNKSDGGTLIISTFLLLLLSANAIMAMRSLQEINHQMKERSELILCAKNYIEKRKKYIKSIRSINTTIELLTLGKVIPAVNGVVITSLETAKSAQKVLQAKFYYDVEKSKHCGTFNKAQLLYRHPFKTTGLGVFVRSPIGTTIFESTKWTIYLKGKRNNYLLSLKHLPDRIKVKEIKLAMH